MFSKVFRVGIMVVLAAGCLSAAYETSPTQFKYVPEVIWSGASGGGTWQTEVQIMARNDNTTIHLYFFYGGGNFRNITLSSTYDKWDCFKTSNVLQYMGIHDADYDFYNKVGALWVGGHDSDHRVLVSARTWHSNGYAKSINGISHVDGLVVNASNTIGAIMNIRKDGSFRTSVACNNLDIYSIEVQFYIMSSNGGYVGEFTKTFTGWDFQAFDPFAEAGLTGNYTNHYLYAVYRSGSGDLAVIAASANNATNDPAAHTMQSFIY